MSEPAETAFAEWQARGETELSRTDERGWQAGIKLDDMTILSDWRPSPALAVTSLQIGVNDHGRALGLEQAAS